MKLIDTLVAGNIASIDFDLKIDSDCYAQTTIIQASPRCKAYYCFKNDDTREDGEDRCSQDAFDTISKTLATLLSNNDNGSVGLKYNMVITDCDKHKHVFRNDGTSFNADCDQAEEAFSLSALTLKGIINVLAEQITEFGFLPAFRPHI